MTLELKPGRFYKSKAGDVWCCYRVDKKKEEHASADAIGISPHVAGRTEYFYLDGRYDSEGERKHCLVEECGPNGEKLEPARYLFKLSTDGEASSGGLNDLCAEALRIAVEHGFTDATPGEDLMLMVTELAEAMEDVRAVDLDEVWYEEKIAVLDRGGSQIRIDGEPVWFTRKHPTMYVDGRGPFKPCGLRSELADAGIRVFHFCGKHKIDLARAVDEKMAYNASRPFKHGGKKL